MIKRLPLLASLIAAMLAFGASATAFAGLARSRSAASSAAAAQPSVSGAQSASASSADSAGDANVLATAMQPPLQPVPSATPTPTPPPASAGATIPAPLTERTANVLHVPVLMYHYISAVPVNQANDRFAVDLRGPPDLFEQHLAYLPSQGYKTLGVPA